MNVISEKHAIPKYPFEPDANSRNPMFRIHRIDNKTNRKKTEFLVPHRKDYYFFAFVKQGNSRHWIDMKPYTLKPDTFYFTTPHQVHLKEETRPFTGIGFSFSREFPELEGNIVKALSIIQNPYNGHELQLNSEDLTFVEDILDKTIAEYRGVADWQNSMISAYMRVLLIYLSRLYNEQFSEEETESSRALLKKFTKHIEESFSQCHEVSDYAALMNLSAGHLSELVKEQSGKPAISHIHERISLEAKRLLFHTEQSVKEIAFSLGFEDASYFNRFFKRINSQTPLQYRQNIREMYH